MRYERQVLRHLSLLVLGKEDLTLRPGPWIEFIDRSGKRWCQPDAFLLSVKNNYCFIYEVKYQHTADAWWQLTQLYAPVLAVLYPWMQFGLVEICHWHDPLVKFPEPYDLTDSPFRIPNGRRVAVHIWSGKRHQLGVPIP